MLIVLFGWSMAGTSRLRPVCEVSLKCFCGWGERVIVTSPDKLWVLFVKGLVKVLSVIKYSVLLKCRCACGWGWLVIVTSLGVLFVGGLTGIVRSLAQRCRLWGVLWDVRQRSMQARCWCYVGSCPGYRCRRNWRFVPILFLEHRPRQWRFH